MLFNLNDFAGPLDVLLALIEDKKKDISEIAISEVTDQFLQYLDALEEKDPDEVADFLVVAAKLLFLKSKALLPQFLPEEDEGPSLAEQLRLYKRFVEASKKINEFWLKGRSAAYRIEPSRVIIPTGLPSNVSATSLAESMRKVLQRLKPPKALPTTTIDKSVSLKEKIDRIRSLLGSGKNFSFFGNIAAAENKTDVIVSFLALLELVKQQVVGLQQSTLFGDISIQKY